MNTRKEATPPSLLHSRPGRETTKSLLKKIFESNAPEQFVRSVPAQSIYQIVREYGVAETSEVLELLTRDKFQTLLDFDLWHGDQFNESRLWDWLELPEATEDLRSLQKVLSSIDLKLVALLIARHISIVRSDEPTDQPPAPEYYTPDKGYTWVLVQHPDESISFLLNRFLALIFETSAELFYQLISIPDVTTQAQLEEESYEERQKRLLNEGIPDAEWAHTIHTPLALAQALQLLDRKESEPAIQDILSIRPFIYQERMPEPLRTLLSELPDTEPAEMEITLLVNAGIVRWNVDFSDTQATRRLINSIRGAINVGLQFLHQERPALRLVDIEQTLHIQKIYQAGLQLIFPLRKAATAQKARLTEGDHSDAITLALLDALTEPFPQLPNFIDHNGDVIEKGDGKLEGGFRAIEHLSEVTWVRSVLEK